MHRRKNSPLKQSNCLERDKTKMDFASCEINSEAAHLGFFRILGPLRDWDREMLVYGGRSRGPSSVCVCVCVCVCVYTQA